MRIHADAAAQVFCRDLRSRAVSVGTDIFFRDGMPSGDQLLGRRLLAHELAHAVQHRGHPGATALPIDDADSLAEREASAAADAVASEGAVSSINA
ncbi:MAG TPA: DUF4157 domain-containing protein, partial [Streptosporangiaceae bacterium]